MSVSPAATPPLIQALQQPSCYPQPVRAVELLETHISWVLLTGRHAYKIKKPVKLAFLDFSTLERRRAACEEELRLNRRFAPSLYLDLVPITGSEEAPQIGGAGAVIEYAVRMRQFPQAQQLDRLLAAGELGGGELEAFGRRLAQLHAAAPRAAQADACGSPPSVFAPVQETLGDLLAAAPAGSAPVLARLQAWHQAQRQALAPLLERRKHDGWVRELHGDLHLANLVRLDGAVTPFDCIEFSAALRWIDTFCDLAFLVMDLDFNRRPDLAWRFLNAYLEESGDYGGVRLLHYYVAYRALVRAKIESIRAASAPAEEAARQQASALAHVELAGRWAQPRRPFLLLMHGLSGSGKSHWSARLAPLLPAIRVRSDVERKRLHGLAAGARSGSGLDAGLYSAAASERTYAHLAAAAETVLEGGASCIVDAAFLHRPQRAAFRALAARLEVPCLLLDCQAEAAELRRRVEHRSGDAEEPSEAGRQVLEHQLAHTEPLGADELASTFAIDTRCAPQPAAVAAAIRQRLPPAA